jgi:AraC-like DNA-binding protein
MQQFRQGQGKRPGTSSTRTKTSRDGHDSSDRRDGPTLIALRGDDGLVTAFRLGTREVDWHRHYRGQLFCIDSGFLHLRTRPDDSSSDMAPASGHGSFLLPPHRAGWIPPGTEHRAAVSGVMGGWSIFIAPEACGNLPVEPCVIAITDLMRLLVQRATDWSDQAALAEDQQRLVAVLMDEIHRAPREKLHLPMPLDRRLVKITTALLRRPGDPRSLDDWARWAALSPRTLRRLFQAETGTSFAQWRQQARLILALERLAQGQPVSLISDQLGYASPSNFIAMFRRHFGQPPQRYFARRRLVAGHQIVG